ncbi:MAG: aminopeptidase [Clostridia bacterium]|nr:aminopeptidase [Clostridia bacterium]
MSLFYETKSIYENTNEIPAIFKAAEGYLDFMTRCKTERSCTAYFKETAEKNGYLPLERGTTLKAGDKFYMVNRDRGIFLGIIGKQPVENGLHIAAAHIDSPRIDLKPCPLYENEGLALLKTHYYGGIKKYQWTTIPLALEGIVVLSNGEKVSLAGNDYTFCISELLIHLSQKEMEKTASKVIEGESLRVIAGSIPDTDADKDRVKTAVLKILNKKYGMNEKDFISAELSLVPKFDPAELGFDKSLIAAYGHDDRICAYTAFEALMQIQDIPEKTALVALVDKEETGSDGVSGMQSRFMEMVFGRIAPGVSLPELCYNSKCLSADVNAAFDPLYPAPTELQNCCKLSHGPCITKYTGARGKSGTSDASAETMGYFTRLFDQNNIRWQTGLLGAVDAGGGGTVAKYMANRNIDTVDIGIGLLSMHAPLEIASKADIYETIRAFHAFLK